MDTTRLDRGVQGDLGERSGIDRLRWHGHGAFEVERGRPLLVSVTT